MKVPGRESRDLPWNLQVPESTAWSGGKLKTPSLLAFQSWARKETNREHLLSEITLRERPWIFLGVSIRINVHFLLYSFL